MTHNNIMSSCILTVLGTRPALWRRADLMTWRKSTTPSVLSRSTWEWMARSNIHYCSMSHAFSVYQQGPGVYYGAYFVTDRKVPVSDSHHHCKIVKQCDCIQIDTSQMDHMCTHSLGSLSGNLFLALLYSCLASA